MSRSEAMFTASSQALFRSYPWNGGLRRPVAFSVRHAVFDHGVLAVEGVEEEDVVRAGHRASEVFDVRDDQLVAPAGGLLLRTPQPGG